ncbi:uncharacterized protein DDB_G0284459 [Drosophila mauritiana]|uniref:Uncharacterized protein DDB_G0284459 n=1 Tax=Drosophila mauritiana TaxID=7226 RepID=A0A6P8KHZ6_DROMA|nr:uncharacterized protein DDB_G0284459 [Drosophila mauritiana]
MMSAPTSRFRNLQYQEHHLVQLGANILSRRQWCLCLLIIMSTLCSAVTVTSGTSGNSRRRSGGSGALSSLEDTGEKAFPDQLALAASRRGSDDRGYSRRGSVIQSRSKEASSKDYSFGQVELNLVRPEHESHPKLILSTTTAASGSGASVNLEDSKSAAEYVANAIKLAYKQPPTQLRGQSQNQNPNNNHIQAQKEQQPSTQRSYQEQRRDREILEMQLQKELQQQALLLSSGPSSPSSSGSSSSSSPSSPALAPAPVYEKEPVTRSYELYEHSTEAESHVQAQEQDIERHYRPKYSNNYNNNYAPYQPPQIYRNLEAEAEEKVRVSASTEIPKSEIMKQIEKSVIKYMKELEAEGKIISTPQETATPPPPPPPPPITKTYYKSQTLSSGLHSGSIPSSHSHSHSEEKRYSSSTVRPKYTVPPTTKQQQQQQLHHHQQQVLHPQHHSHQIAGKLRGSSLAITNSKPIQHFQSETETAYQAPDLPVDELSPNVEFIYKIKTRAPLQTATVKTVSKPYTLPLKSAEHFDHGAALKNIEEFDLSHVVPTPDRVERERERERDRERERERERDSREDQERLTNSGKPHKLYFNSEIYHDINALPYKSKEAALQEYRHKLKASGSSGELHPDYKGYSSSGYFAEPEAEGENESKLILNEEGYPYHYVLKKETLLDDHDSWLSHAHGHAHQHAHGHAHSHSNSNKHPSLEYDSYSPKFNNNPEGYGYQHTYKVRGQPGGGAGSGGVAGIGSNTGAGAGKRGKRGGGAHPRQEAIKKQLRSSEVEDLEASLALRPPPK